MKTTYKIGGWVLGILLLLIIIPQKVNAQAPPGWAWAESYGGATVASQEESEARRVGTDVAGNVYVLGAFVGTAGFGGAALATSAGETDVFLAKYTPAGTLVWLRVLGSVAVELPGDLAVSAAGRCVITGIYGGGPTGADLMLPGGQVLQGPRTYGAPTGSGNYGRFPFVACFDAQGNTAWGMRLSPSYVSAGPEVLLTNAGEAILNGGIRSDMTVGGTVYPANGPSEDQYLVKVGLNGQPLWVRRIGLPSDTMYGQAVLDRNDAIYWLLSNSMGGTIALDGVSATMMPYIYTLVKISPLNRLRWIRNSVASWNAPFSPPFDFMGLDAANNQLLFSSLSVNGRTIQFGRTSLSVSAPVDSACSIIGRMDTSGTVVQARAWAKGDFLSRAYPPLVQALLAQPTGELTVVAQAYGSFALAGNPRVYTGRSDIHVTRYAPDGTTLLWNRFAHANAQPTQAGSILTGAALDPAGNVYVVGRFQQSLPFGSTVLQSSRGPYTDGFLAKLDMATPTGTQAARLGRMWSAYPNPATGTVQLSGLPAQATVQMHDAQGRLVRAVQASATAGAESRLELNGLATGVYLLQVVGAREIYKPQRLVVD